VEGAAPALEIASVSQLEAGDKGNCLLQYLSSKVKAKKVNAPEKLPFPRFVAQVCFGGVFIICHDVHLS